MRRVRKAAASRGGGDCDGMARRSLTGAGNAARRAASHQAPGATTRIGGMAAYRRHRHRVRGAKRLSQSNKT